MLTRNEIEVTRDEVKREHNAKRVDMLCDMALRSLSEPAAPEGETPRTDALKRGILDRRPLPMWPEEMELVYALAGTLERELAQMAKRVSELEAALGEKSRGAERANEVTPQELGALVDRLDGVGVAWCTEADFATLLSAAKRDAERQDQAARYGFEPAETVLKTVQRVLDENSAWIAMPNREVEKRIAIAVGFAASVAQEQLRYELMDRAEAAERRASDAEEKLAAWEQLWNNVQKDVPDLRADNKPLAVAATYELQRTALAEAQWDAERLAYLTADHDDAEVRKRRNDLLCRMPVMSHSAACADIDIGLAALAAERKEGKQHV